MFDFGIIPKYISNYSLCSISELTTSGPDMKNFTGKIFILLLVPFIISYSQNNFQNTKILKNDQNSPKATISAARMIEGHWKGVAFGGIAEEIWAPAIGNSMMGSFRLVTDNKVNFYELLSISEENSSLILRIKHFNSDLTGWEEKNEVEEFKLIEIKPNKIFFDGLTFEKIDKDEMNIYVITEDNDGNQNEIKFNFKKVNRGIITEN